MTITYSLKDKTIIGLYSNRKFKCDLTEQEWNRLYKNQQVFGDDLSYFVSLLKLKEHFKNKKWVWSTPHSMNARARHIEESKYYDRDDWIGDIMEEQAYNLRERAKEAVKESLKIIKS
tara:strand:- start:607 stop:960 length:354 start_codon:yes stop_codon:yes gene_type:complete